MPESKLEKIDTIRWILKENGFEMEQKVIDEIYSMVHDQRDKIITHTNESLIV